MGEAPHTHRKNKVEYKLFLCCLNLGENIHVTQPIRAQSIDSSTWGITGRITEANWKENIGKNANIPDVDYPDYAGPKAICMKLH